VTTIPRKKPETPPVPAPAKKKYRVIGTRPIRHDGVDKVTGRAKYGADVQLSGMLYGATLRSPHAHAKILLVDTTAAWALPGVRAVITRDDLPDPHHRTEELGEGAVDIAHLSRNVMAREKALYRGHVVAAVAADDIHTAEEATRLIRVEYEVLPPVLSALDGMKDDAPVLLDSLRTQSIGGAKSDRPTNIARHFRYEKGNVAEGFAKAKVVIERSFDTATVHQGYIEPHNATAQWNADGRVTIWTSTQGAFVARDQVAGLLGMPVSRIKVVPMEIGGGFGGKIAVYLEPLAAVLSRKAGRPVKLVMDRTSVFEATGPTPASHIRVKIGADESGRITAAEAWLAYEAGAFPGSPINPGCMCIFACYDVPHGRVDGYDVVVNKPRTNAYRAPGATNAAMAAETVIDEICEQLQIDPLDFRTKNAAKEGTRRIDGPVYSRIGMAETVAAIRESEHWKSPLGGPNRGRGVASGFWFNAGLQSSATATVNTDGRVSLVEGSTDIGGSRTGIAMQLAETLGLSAEEITPTVADTDGVGYTDVTGGSRVTYATGWAAYEAGQDIRRQMIERAAVLWDVTPAQVTYEDDGTLHGPDERRITFRELAAKLGKTGGPVTGRGISTHNKPGGAFATHLVDVEIDPETGKVTILRYTAAQDVGTAIHPSYVEGQVQGGVVQGIGWALNEEYVYDASGRMRNASFLDYRMPTCYDVPPIDPILVEVPNPGHPFGVRGVGEVPIVPPPAAIANAIYQAIGVRMFQLPMSPPRLLHEFLAKQNNTAG
jgi:xanthine dehydrogenase molybdenum-binding subunit